MWNQKQHTYEEVREVVVDILLKRVSVEYEPSQWSHLTRGVAELFAKRARIEDRACILMMPSWYGMSFGIFSGKASSRSVWTTLIPPGHFSGLAISAKRH